MDFHVLKPAVSGTDSFLYCVTSPDNPFPGLFTDQQIPHWKEKPYMKKQIPLKGHLTANVIKLCPQNCLLSSDGRNFPAKCSNDNELKSWHC